MVEKIIEEFKYWPTKSDFVREAVLEKLEKYENTLKPKVNIDDRAQKILTE